MNSAEIESIIKRVVGRHVNLQDTYVFLFGSRAFRSGSPASDFDVGLYSGSRIPFSVTAKIQDELENYPIPVDVDLVDFSLASDEFKKLALQNIQIWNTPKKNFRLI